MICLRKRGGVVMSEDVHRRGKTIDEIKEGDSLTVTESISDRDLLLYLGITNDNNPLYIQHDYARDTEYQKPIVPPVLLTGIITSSISRSYQTYERWCYCRFPIHRENVAVLYF